LTKTQKDIAFYIGPDPLSRTKSSFFYGGNFFELTTTTTQKVLKKGGFCLSPQG
jgi:hypothetical protein